MFPNKKIDYRPISLPCILCKVMEHIIASNVVKHLDSKGLTTYSTVSWRDVPVRLSLLLSLRTLLVRQAKENRHI